MTILPRGIAAVALERVPTLRPPPATGYSTTTSINGPPPQGTRVNSELGTLSPVFLAARWPYFRETQGRRTRVLNVEFHEWAETPGALRCEHFHQQVGES